MPNAPKTLEAVDRATFVLFPDDESRRHLGASIVGDKCARKVFYKFRWFKTKGVHKARLKRLFHRGHREELELIPLLRAAGVTVYAAGESGELKEQLRISDVDGHFGGTPDGVGVGVPDLPADMPVLLEFKTMNDKQFKETREDGVMTAHWEYFIQMQIYMEKHGLTAALFTAVNKNDDEIYMEIVHANKPQADHYISRARDIIYAVEPPPRIADSPARYPCKFCDFSDLCHFSNLNFPEVNCRTCTHGTVGPQGTWECAKGRVEIGEQKGCPEHLYEPRFFDGWSVIGGSFEENWLQINDGTSTFKTGPRIRGYTSQDLFKDGLIPF